MYLILDLLTLAFPLVLSFDKKVHFVSKWKFAFLSSLIVAIPFLIWDYYFTVKGVWGFNSDFITGINLSHLPLEEILFFLVVPFACIFIYECCKYYIKKISIFYSNVVLISAISLLSIVLIASNPTGWYTLAAFSSAALTSFALILFRQYRYIGVSFMLSLIPFVIMNGILTGMSTEAPIVWYDPEHFSTLRFITIPLEDILYSYSLIVPSIIIFERFISLNEKNRSSF